jgi:hypothetical protein
MKDIGYYAGFLSTEDKQKVNDAPISDLAGAIIVLSYYIYQEHDHNENSVLDIPPPKSERDRLALIRALCDRIELKLMEAAK